MIKRLSIMVLTSILLFSVKAQTEAAAQFPDVQSYTAEIGFLADKKIINGYGDGTFKPQEPVRRIQAVRMILRALGEQDIQQVKNPGFKDMQPGMDGYNEVARAVELGIISGKPDGTFQPFGTLTRAQMAKILVNAYSLEGGYNKEFTDVFAKDWHHSFIMTLAGNRVTTGYGDASFRPLNTISREHFAVFLSRVLNDSFKPMESYKQDRHFVYHFDINGKPSTEMYEGSYNGVDYWFYKQDDVADVHGFRESETGLGYLFADEEEVPLLAYPVEFGKSFESKTNDAVTKNVVTNVYKELKTEARTFYQVVEVTNSLGYRSYYAPGVGLVKMIHSNGTVQTELKDLSFREDYQSTLPASPSYLPSAGLIYFYKNANGDTLPFSPYKSEIAERAMVQYPIIGASLYNSSSWRGIIQVTVESEEFLQHYDEFDGLENLLAVPVKKGSTWSIPANYGSFSEPLIKNNQGTVVDDQASYKLGSLNVSDVVVVKKTPPPNFPLYLSEFDLDLLFAARINDQKVEALYSYYGKGLGLLKREAVVGGKRIPLFSLTALY
ncbi:hypothetical protein JOC78_002268 [Bacillus ectoiniformans]|uniref:S-layer homology domain-containing protein n=1 Tax=Bacillus ectoiniformans TaxID=1494429 RepID=UPI00195A0B66|nr:S-layer homology domain-containing protein [Bacillus ectoiniformans]MBM7649315.1 hypothetical protein [Bacillus ectoiniformans]